MHREDGVALNHTVGAGDFSVMSQEYYEAKVTGVSILLVGSRLDVLTDELESTAKLVLLGCISSEGGVRRARMQPVISYPNIDAELCEICSLIDALSPEALEQWRQLTDRMFEVVVQSGIGGYLEMSIDVTTIKQVAAYGARMSLVVYAPRRVQFSTV